MQGSKALRRGVVLVVVASVAALVPLAVAVTPAGAQVAPAKAGPLSPRLVELAERAQGGPSTNRADNLAVDLAPDGPGSLLRSEGDLVVNVRFATAVAPADEARLQAAGARVISRLAAEGLVAVAVPASGLDAVASVRGVVWVEEVLEPRVGRAGGALDRRGLARALQDGGATTSATCAPVISEGDVQLAAATARSTYGVDGTGVIVGVLSDSYDNKAGAAADVAAGELPGPTNPCGRTTPVQVQSDLASGGSDEGRAMAQVIHDLAPGATIRVATAFNGDVDFANQIRNLAAAGAKVIVDDVSYFNEAMYQDGVIAKAIVDVTAAGVTYYSSAGNQNLRVGSADVAGYEAPAYRPTSPCPSAFGSGSSYTCHDWDPGAGVDTMSSISLDSGAAIQVRLGWSQPQYGITTDLDLVLLDSTGAQVIASSTADNIVGQTASEILSYTNTTGAARTVSLVVARYATPGTPRFRFAFQNYTGSVNWEWSTPGAGDTVGPVSIGHNMMRGAGSIAAIRYNATTAPETFSSRGPATYCWNPVSGTTAATALPACVAVNPTLTATNGGANSFFGQLLSGVWRFFGTSQSAPHAAAIAALQVQARPCRTPAEVLAAQQASAVAVGSFTAAAVGAGRVQAPGAIANLAGCVPGAPTAVTGSPGDGQVVLSWTAPGSNGGSPVTGYRVTPYVGATAQTPIAFASTATTQTITGLTNGLGYTFRVAATSTNGTGPDSSASATITPRTVPGAPTAVAGTAGDGFVDLQWTAPASNGGSPVTGYRVTPYVGATAQTPLVFSVATTSQRITGLTNGVGYTFRVAATNAAGTGADSTASSVITPAAVPGAPTNVTGTPGDGQVALSWTAPASSGGSPISGYRVTPYVGATAQTPIAFASTATTQTIGGLMNGTPYTFRVAAINVVGAGPDSTASATITPRTVPGAPTAVTGTAGDGFVDLQWNAPWSTGGSAITGYRVTPYVGATPQTPRVFSVATTSQRITGLTNGVGYTFRVAATNAAGTGADSTASSVITPVGVPGAPTNVTATAGDRQVTVSWSPPASDGGAAISGYVVKVLVGGVEQLSVPASGTTKTVTGLTNGTTYTFRVVAVNVRGGGAESSSSSAVTPRGVPGPPTDVSATALDGAAIVSWLAPSDDGASPITGYRVTPVVGGVAQTPVTFSSAATTQTVTGLANGTAHTFRVAAINAVGTGSDSSASSSVTPRSEPGAPTNVTGTAGDGQVVLSWTAPVSSGGSPITGYEVHPVVAGIVQPAIAFASTATTQTISGLTNGTTYRFRVAAVNAAGTGPKSASSPELTPVAPLPPFSPFTSWAALVTRIHTDLLGVAPTTAARDAYVARLTAGSLTPGGFVAELRASADNVGNVDPVTRLYRAYFLRIPDRGGLTYWIRQRRVNGKKLNAISDSFAASSEFRTKYGSLTNRQFVELVYVNVLGRPGEKSGVDFWTSRLDRKVATRGQVMTGFSESNEYRRKQVAEVDVSVLFILLLGRAPTASEFGSLVAALEEPSTTLEEVAADLISSDAFASRIGG